MTEKRRPDTRIVLKPIKGDGTITLASFWTDQGRPSGGLDRRIKKLHLLLEDGTKVLVENEHGSRTHYCNLYVDRGEQTPRGRRNGGGAEWSGGSPPADDFDDSDIPF